MLDEADIRAFVSTDYPRLVAGLAVVLGGRAAAEDAVQEALVRAWERSRRGEHIESLRSWMAVVAMNLLRSRLRRLATEARASERLADRDMARAGPLSEVRSTEDRLDLAGALRSLPRRQREALVLYYFADLDVAGTARALRIRKGAAKALLHRGRASLAAALGPAYRAGETDA